MKIKYLVPLLFLVACSTPTKDILNQTVKITNLSENSGGSGSIVESGKNGSKILTNAHVCEVVARGGLVHTLDKKYMVKSYKQSERHDLCLITVAENLGVAAPLADSPPNFFEEGIVSGHPRLLPIVVNKGHFTGRRPIEVGTGVRKCTLEEQSHPKLGLVCAILGGIPVIKVYDALFISALIQPGSSGSAIYNLDGEIEAVIFAGSGGINYGFAVPHEYVQKFVKEESKLLPESYPELNRTIFEEEGQKNLTDYYTNLLQLCKNKPEVKDFCDTWLPKLNRIISQ